MSSEIDTVVFDLGGVLIDWNPATLFEAELSGDVSLEQFLRETKFDEWNMHHDLGGSWDIAAADVRARHPEHAELFAQYVDRFGEVLSEMPDTLEVVHELRARDRRVFALTNYGVPSWAVTVEMFSWLDLFDGIVVSGHEGVIKPDEAIYRILIDRFDVVPARTVFIDDRQINVDAAKKLGFTAFVFEDAATLRDQLRQYGVLG